MCSSATGDHVHPLSANIILLYMEFSWFIFEAGQEDLSTAATKTLCTMKNFPLYYLQALLLYQCLKVNKIDFRGCLLMFPIISSKHESPVVINAGESEGNTGRRPSTTDGRGGPDTCRGHMKLILRPYQFDVLFLRQTGAGNRPGWSA